MFACLEVFSAKLIGYVTIVFQINVNASIIFHGKYAPSEPILIITVKKKIVFQLNMSYILVVSVIA